jgi:hypothetical protein
MAAGSLQVQNYNGGAVNDMNWTFPYLDSPGVVTSTNYSFNGGVFHHRIEPYHS